MRLTRIAWWVCGGVLALARLPHSLAAQDDPRITLTFLDVGQGDAALVRTPDGKAVLIDAGPVGARVADQLASTGLDSLDLAIASHPHADHIGGMRDVIVRIPVRAYLDNATPHTTRTYRALMDALLRSSVTYLEPMARTIEVGTVKLRILPPPAETSGHNNSSVGVLLEFGEFRALFVGDAEVDELNHFLRLGVPRVTVLKASHHGAPNGVSPGWINATRPQAVVISVGDRNSYGHPEEAALRYYRIGSTAIYRTDRHGRIVIHGHRDGTFTVETEHATEPTPR